MRWDFCSRDQGLSLPASSREPQRWRAGGQGCGPAAELELPNICYKRHRFPRCSSGPADGALPNEWLQEPSIPPSLGHPGLASWTAGPRPCVQLPVATRPSWEEGPGSGVSLGQESVSGEEGGEVTGWGRDSPCALHM